MISASETSLALDQTYGRFIVPITATARHILYAKQITGQNPQLSKKERARLKDILSAHEQLKIVNGINFSRAQAALVHYSYEKGERLEFETLGPYLADYIHTSGTMTSENLTPEDAIGLELAVTLQEIFPKAFAVSLYDDYNSTKSYQEINTATFSKTQKDTFRQSLLDLLKTRGITKTQNHDIIYPLLIPESNMVRQAERLVEHLERVGHIRRSGDEISFVNKDAENPLHLQIRLRTKTGKWLCEALDTATYFEKLELNQVTTHVVILPDYMKDQQDKVWEILRVLGIRPERYHNLFYSPHQTPQEVSDTIRFLFSKSFSGSPQEQLKSLAPSLVGTF